MPEIFINEETRCHISARITIELIANEADEGHGEICRASATCRSGDVFDIDRGFKMAETRLVKLLRRSFPALDDHMNMEALARSKESRRAIWAVLLDWNRRRKLERLKLAWAEVRRWNPKWLDWNRFLRIMTGEKQKSEVRCVLKRGHGGDHVFDDRLLLKKRPKPAQRPKARSGKIGRAHV